MSSARVNGITLHYERTGRGPAVVLLSGLGADGHFWYRQVPALAARFQVITVDNRGAGRSEAPDVPYTLRMMADDVVELLDAMKLRAAHVVGASMGGFIAQEFALAYPDRVDRLVLCCTSPGGPASAPIPDETLQVLRHRTGDPEQDLRTFLALQFATDYPVTHTRDIDAYVAWRVAHPQPGYAYQRQLAAATAHDAAGRLQALRGPVLVLHGTQDRVVPAANAHLLVSTIPGARLHLFQGGHLFLWEHADEANRLIMEFLGAHDGARDGVGETSTA